MREHHYWVYILASRRNGTLYIGMTNDLYRRMVEHRTGVADGFTKKYGIRTLVWFEEFQYVTAAIEREKRSKKWNRAWKLQLIEGANPEWNDLFDVLFPDVDVRAELRIGDGSRWGSSRQSFRARVSWRADARRWVP